MRTRPRVSIHNERELAVARSATHVVARTLRGGRWSEAEIRPARGHSLADLVLEAQRACRLRPEMARIGLYLADEEGGRCVLPTNHMPPQIEEAIRGR